MPRRERVKPNSKIYHVMCRALNKQVLFDEEEDFLFYLNLIKKNSVKENIKIYAYCLMTNHVHIMIKDIDDNLNIYMKGINVAYAKYYNKKYGRTGYVFNDRFHSEPIEKNKYFLTCMRYIHQNPVKAMICAKTYDYKFSSIHAYRSDKGNYLELVDTKYILDKFDKKEFLKWTEANNNDRCMDVMCNKMSDGEVSKLLYDTIGVKGKREYLQKTEAEKVLAVLKLLDFSIPMMQLARVSGIYYNKIQKLRIGKVGETISLTYKH